MRFRDSLWDDSEPDYAPFLKYRKDRDRYFWRPSKKYLEAGYKIKTYDLGGSQGDGLDLERAAHCRALTREMLDWFDGEAKGRKAGTWGWLIGRYLSDEFSSFHDVLPQTQDKYRQMMGYIEKAIGNVLIEDTDFERIMRWKKSMLDKGRSTHYIKKWFTHWRLIVSHGIKIGNDHCSKVKAIREEVRIQNPPRRSNFATREQIDAIVTEADRTGRHHLSLAILMRFEFILRGVDVHGQWVKADTQQGGVRDGGQIWVDGLTWDMFDREVTQFTKVISKTRKSLTEPYTFTLEHTPDIRRRLLAIPRDQRTGPVITLANGKPPKNGVLSRGFKEILRAVNKSRAKSGLEPFPDELQIRDTRAGGITEAKSLVDPTTLQHAAQHTQGNTTAIYTRDRSGAANNVVEIRAKRG
ncbi:hypothetical protein [Tritonibacter mobilis]|uniref:Tyr recombinase domain-containing protein n=1 Tax=Tritonibacter mobilis F1926 TaxID=1265309 RepID=A0A1B1A1Y9_9RHOB|nr:hypothetical protein [Tritonibacter mobilis]ANP40610.1 hypothetical protein K529_007525 [Tritonibacter mobilis F1926]KJZ25047.1 hypothetical protein TW79_05090 [Tritonibacter mobilis]